MAISDSNKTKINRMNRAAQNVKLGDIIQELTTESGVFAAMSGSASTTIVTSGSYYPIQGTFTNVPMVNFSFVSTPAIRYDGKNSPYFRIAWSATMTADANGTTVYCAVKKSGSLVTPSIMGQYIKTSGEWYNLVGISVVELTQNDEIQLVVTSDGDGDKITFLYYTTSISPFFNT